MVVLYNTRSRQLEEFRPQSSQTVGVYHCGPTVYARAHIGNLRAFVIDDILRRTLEWNGYSVRQIMNITDVGHLQSDADEGEDKMTAALTREGKELTMENMRALAERNATCFEEDVAALNIKHPTALPFASEHINEQIDIIKGLEARGFTYITSDGVYFETAKDPRYGSLRGNTYAREDERRIAHNPEKRDQRDFALWKFNSSLGWDSPWGKGFPGWHLECSAMSMKYLGESFDIHTGGVEHIGTHHVNEIAQSENLTGKPLARYWIHNEHLLVDGAKMSKSLGNTYTLLDIVERGFEPLHLRYFFLGAHYRTQQNFTWEALEAAKRALSRLHYRALELGDPSPTPLNASHREEFKERINDDLDTVGALAVLWDMLRDDSLADSDKLSLLLDFDQVLGLGLDHVQEETVPEPILELIRARELARQHNDFTRADELRKEIENLGYSVNDTDAGPRVRKQ